MGTSEDLFHPGREARFEAVVTCLQTNRAAEWTFGQLFRLVFAMTLPINCSVRLLWQDGQAIGPLS